jgi:hypothetical protein
MLEAVDKFLVFSMRYSVTNFVSFQLNFKLTFNFKLILVMIETQIQFIFNFDLQQKFGTAHLYITFGLNMFV